MHAAGMTAGTHGIEPRRSVVVCIRKEDAFIRKEELRIEVYCFRLRI